MVEAKIEKYNGESAIVVNGKAYPPMTATVKTADKEYLKRLGDTGIRIFYVSGNMEWPVNGVCERRGYLEGTLKRIRAILEVVPEAYIILRINVNPSVAWINAHPSEQVLFSDGTHEPVICNMAAGNGPVDGMISFASTVWREESVPVIKGYLEELEQTEVVDKIIGFFICAGGTGEWYYPGVARMHNDAKGTYADFSEPFRKWYSDFLKNKYGTEEELRRVWNRPDATFDAPIIPDLIDRAHVHTADAEIARGLKDWEDYNLGGSVNTDARLQSNIGVFLNANEYMHTADFFMALHDATADTIVFFAKLFKELKPNLLAGAFYGYFGCTDYYDASHCTGVLSLLDSGVIDFLAGPGTYNNREPGGVVAQREMQDSFRIRNKIFISEDDSRTHYCLPLIQRESMAIYTAQDSINTLKRDFARNICEDIQGWWFDMGIYYDKPWYDDPEILQLFTRQQEIGEFAYSLDRTKKNEIAIIYDTESVHLVSDSTDQLVLDFFRTSDLHRIGAPIDYYFHNDMSNPAMPDYKLYVMLNTYCLTDEEREAIFAKARKNHATVLWMYAPGLVNKNADKVLDIANLEKTVGMNVELLARTTFPWFNVDPKSHQAVCKAKEDLRYGYIDRNVHSNLWVTPTVLPPVYANPGFVIKEDDNLTVLGRYCSTGGISYAMREDLGFTSVYCCAQVIRNELIASLAEYSGCHIYTDSEDVLYANENFVAIHASYSGKRRIQFPQPCSPYEVYEKRYYGHNIEYLELDLKLGETKMFYKETNN